MDELEKIQNIIKEIKTTGFKELTKGVRLSKKHLKDLNYIVAEMKLGGTFYDDKFDAKKLISDSADEAFDTELINKILTGEGTGGLGQFKTSNMENIGNIENIGGVKSKQIFKQSAGKVPRTTETADGTTVNVEISRGLSDIQDDIDIAKRISKVGDDVRDFSDNELRLTSQYKISKNKGLSDAAALRVTKGLMRRAEKYGKGNPLSSLPSANKVSRKASELSRQAEKDLSYLEKESGLYGDKYFGPADAHVKEYNLTSIANQSNIGKQIPFSSGAEVREYNQMVQEFDKIEYSPAEKQTYYSGKRIDDTELDNLESSKVGLTGSVNPTDATQTNPMAVENYGDMKIGGGFTPVYMEDLEAAAKIQYEKAYGDAHPINTVHPTEGKTFNELGFKEGDKFVIGITKEGKTVKGVVGPELPAAKERTIGSVAFGKDMTEPRFDTDVYNERASKTNPGQIEIYAINKKEKKATNVPKYNPSTDRPRTISGAEYKTQQSLVGQMNQLKAMYPNVANKNNLVRLAVRNMEKQLGLPANKKLLLNLSKFF